MNPIAKYDAIVASGQFNRPAKELLLKLVQVFLDYEIPLHKIEFGKAAPVDQRPEVATDPDTFVQAAIDPEYDFRFPGEDGFLYRRLPITLLTPNYDLEIIAPEFPFTTVDLLEQINRTLGIVLSEDDIVNEEYDYGSTVFTLKIAPGCWVWQGQRTLTVNFTGIPSYARITTDSRLRITTDGSPRIASVDNG